MRYWLRRQRASVPLSWVADLVGVSKHTVRRAVASGELTPSRFRTTSGRVFEVVSWSDVDRLMRRIGRTGHHTRGQTFGQEIHEPRQKPPNED